MRLLLLFLAAALAWASPAVARDPAPADEASPEAIAAEMAAYGQWLVRLTELQQPVQVQLSALSGHWEELERAGFREGSARFRGAIEEMLASIDGTILNLEALETPEFPSLELDGDLRTIAVKRDVLVLDRQVRAMIEGYIPLVEAIGRNDGRAAQTAGQRLMGSIRLIFESQVLLSRASLAATPREDVTWEIANIQYLYYRIAARVFAAFPTSTVPQRDPGLSNELIALAGEVETTSRAGAGKLEAALDAYEVDLEQVRKTGNSAAVLVVERAIAVTSLYRDLFPIGSQLASITRESAESFRNTVITPDDVSGFFQRLRPLREGMERIIASEAAAMAGEP